MHHIKHFATLPLVAPKACIFKGFIKAAATDGQLDRTVSSKATEMNAEKG